MIDASISPVGGAGAQDTMRWVDAANVPSPENASMTAIDADSSMQVVDLFSHVNLDQGEYVAAELRAFADSLANPNNLGERVLSSLEEMRASFATFKDEATTRFGLDAASPADVKGPMFDGPAATNVDFSGDASGLDQPGDVDRTNADYSERFEAVEQEWREILWLQYNMGRVVVHEELASKVAGRSSQNLDTLLRGQ